MQDVLALLMKIGIIGKICGQKRKRITITGERNVGLFREKVDFRIKRKRNLLAFPSKNSNHPSLGDKIISIDEAARISRFYIYKKSGNGWTRLKDKREKYPFLFVSRYEKNVDFVPVKKISFLEGKYTLYDITVNSKDHLFVLRNGIVSHNSNFVNSDMSPDDARSMCCRLRIDNRELHKRGGGLFGSSPLTGSIGVVTINLPRIGYLSKTKKEFFQRLGELMDLAKKSLEIKRKAINNFSEKGLYPYSVHYLEGVKKIRGSYWGNHFSTIGLIGTNEALLNFIGKDIASKEGLKLAVEIMDFMRERLVRYQEETGNFYNLEATPAEGTAYSLARLDKERYPDIITAGTSDNSYYTNSTQLPVNYTDDLFEALRLQDPLQSRYTGGTVFHAFLGEKVSDWRVVPSLIQKVFSNFTLPYFSLTPTFSICPVHGYLPGEHFTCPKCVVPTKCEVYSRVVGYLRPVQQWNKGKAREFEERKVFNIGDTK